MAALLPPAPEPAAAPAAEPGLTVAVRTLCGFTARAGDLDLRFTPSPTGLQGLLGHQLVAGRRPASYQAEIPLQSDWGPLRVRGRADGFDPVAGRLEEVKTHRGDLARQPANHRALHWAQARVYGAMLCEARGLPALTLALVYLDLGSGEETVIEEAHDAASLRAFFEAQCRAYVAWARQEAAHRAARDAALAQLPFPHAAFRPGQRELAEAVWRAARQGRSLMAQAPTGIGKTVGTLFPLLRALPAQGLDRVFFLAAKTPGRQLALDALARLRTPQGLPLRVLELTAREKACEHPDKACHGESCPLAQGFYDRLPAARAQALAAGTADQATLREVARAHAVCPYWLSHELARWADVVVGDYHYVYDTSALLHALAQDQAWRVAVLVDEAHNLLERARGMYTATLHELQLRGLRKRAPAALAKPLDKLARAWREAVRDQACDYVASDALPDRLVKALQLAAAAISDHLAETPPGAPDAAAADLQQFLFDALAFTRLAETFGPHSVFDITRAAGGGIGRGKPATVLCIRNLLPAPHLAPRFAAAHATVLFSATLGPPAFCRDTLGLPADTVWVEVDSPFEAHQLEVRLAPRISTRWADRARSVGPIADLIARQYAERPGNYLAFFSSYEYLGAVAARLAQDHPGVPQWQQSAGMREEARREFVARFEPGGRGVGFAVLGGSFGEGIDLPGDRLVGAFVATLGLPQVNPVNELLRGRLQAAFGQGFDYAYLYPGLRKVVQAAGRVIRTREDRGVVWLIDDRFCRPEVRAMLPRWWRPQVAG
ncbi:ATP-dependent DNA helicase [Ramlibacter sp. MAHUQ-53]|uniref:ATP-dependent DNA helicase n=1 Tax=unclassified Ramlibacter TaxID=2617605 RepID=UPI0036426B2A